MSRRAHRYAALLAPADIGAASSTRSEGFSCEGCGSPAVHLPSDLSGDGLVICDGCQRPIATLAVFRAYVDRLAAGDQFCDHHLAVRHSDAAAGSDQVSST